MTVYTTLTVNGNVITDTTNITLRRSMSDNISTGRMEFDVPNWTGYHKGDFPAGTDVLLESDIDTNPATTDLFGGVITEVTFNGQGSNKETMHVICRDYTSLLQRNIVDPEVYTNQEISLIVINLVQKYAPTSFTTNNVSTTTVTLPRITFKGVSLFDALKQLAELAGSWFFYVDEAKNFFFRQKGKIFNTGRTVAGVPMSQFLTIDNTNATKSSFTTDVESVKNRVYVYGARQVINYPTENFTGDGTGSVFTLKYSPTNTQVSVSGAQKKGDVYNGAQTTTSGPDFLVNYTDKQIIFLSGTSLGYTSIPGSLVTVAVTYGRTLPIVKLAEDFTSINNYGKRTMQIVDANINDATLATSIARNQILLHKDPKIMGTVTIKGVLKITPGNSCTVNLPYEGHTNESMVILEANYTFNTINNQSEQVLQVKVGDRIQNILDVYKDMIVSQKKADLANVDTNSVTTRLISGGGSYGLQIPTWSVKTRVVDDSFILGHPLNGILGITNPSMIGFVQSGTWATGAGMGYNRAVSLIGSPSKSFISISGLLNVLPTGAGTIAGWYNLQTSITSGVLWYVGSDTGDGFGGDPELELTCNAGGGSLSFLYYDPTQRINISTNSNLPIGSWAHVTATWTGSNTFAKLYFNGSLVASGLQSSHISGTNVNRFLIGGPPIGTGVRSTPMLVDDFRLYARDLSLAEVGSLYAQVDVKPGLIGYYKLGETVGSTVYNSASVEMPTSNAILHYRFNSSGASIVDEVTGKIGSENTNNTTLWLPGVYGNGSSISTSGIGTNLGFNLFNDMTSLQFTSGDNFSVATWVNIGSGNFIVASNIGIVSKGATSTCNYGIQMISGPSTTAQYQFGYRSGTDSHTVISEPLPRNQWNHIVGIYSGANYTMQIFYNGSPGSVLNTGGSPFNGGLGSLMIGRSLNVINSNAASGIPLQFDEVRIYNRALSAGEIQNLYYGKTVQPLLGDRRSALVTIASGVT